MSRVRRSIHRLEEDYNNGKRAELEKLIRAWRGIMDLEPHHPNSFFNLAAFHGEPFRGPGVTDPTWWGGYCNHNNILFPTWHRAYLWKFEEALRSIPGCEDVTLPYWDELLDRNRPLPRILTSKTFTLDGKDVPNPLYSYVLQQELVDNVKGSNSRYTKPKGYETVRYPQSGLVGTAEDQKVTEVQNRKFNNAEENAAFLNHNVRQWLEGGIELPENSEERIPDTYSVRMRYLWSLAAPDYNVFSNLSSQQKFIEESGLDLKKYAVSLESPHNAIHLSLGGFYQKGEYNANEIQRANGDIGANETASFDPVFYLHHCFVDYVFWLWQRVHHQTTKLKMRTKTLGGDTDPGTITATGMPNMDPGTPLTMETPLYPFRHRDQTYMTSNDVTDIKAMGYEFEIGSIELMMKPQPHIPSIPWNLGEVQQKIVGMKRISNINRRDYQGSFVIRTTVDVGDRRVEIGREPVLSRMDVEGCANCQDKLQVESFVPIYEGMMEKIVGNGPREEVAFSVDIQTYDRTYERVNLPGFRAGPTIGDLY